MNDPAVRERMEQDIANGLKPLCPICRSPLSIGKKQQGQSGEIGYTYKCSKDSCSLSPGLARASVGSQIRRAMKSQLLKLVLTAIGSVTVVGVVGYLTNVITFSTQAATERGAKKTLVALPEIIAPSTKYFVLPAMSSEVWMFPIGRELEGEVPNSNTVFRVSFQFTSFSGPSKIELLSARSDDLMGYAFLTRAVNGNKSFEYLPRLRVGARRFLVSLPDLAPGDELLILVSMPGMFTEEELAKLFTLKTGVNP